MKNNLKELNREFLVTLLNIPRVTRKKAFGLLEHLSYDINDARDFIDYVKDSMRDLYDIIILDEVIEQAFSNAQLIFQKSAMQNINIITFFDKDYPKCLRNIDDPPLILNYIGNIKCLNSLPAIGIIGTRNPSPKGFDTGMHLAELASEQLFVVVSGLAKGCDTSAHLGTLNVNGVTAAVLAHGLDTVYPKENKKLAEDILEADGCLISEYFINTRAFAGSFVERDRIQAGLSIAILVIETDVEGGTMHTVKYSQKYNRHLYCLKYDGDNSNHWKSYQGNLMLMRENKAKPIDNDIVYLNILHTLSNTFQTLCNIEFFDKDTIEPKKVKVKQTNLWDNYGTDH